MVTVEGDPQLSGELSAFVGTHMRGRQATASTPPFGPYAGSTMFQMTIGADVAGETVIFKFAKSATESYILAETMIFLINAAVGDVLSPFQVSS